MVNNRSVLSAVAVFDALRTVRFNRYLHEHQMLVYRRRNRRADLVALLATSTVGVGIWLQTTSAEADAAVKALAVLAAATSLYQFLAKPNEAASAHEAYLAIYESLDATLDSMVRRIKVGDYSADILNELDKLLTSARSVNLPRTDPPEDTALTDRLFARVNKELPPSYFTP